MAYKDDFEVWLSAYKIPTIGILINKEWGDIHWRTLINWKRWFHKFHYDIKGATWAVHRLKLKQEKQNTSNMTLHQEILRQIKHKALSYSFGQYGDRCNLTQLPSDLPNLIWRYGKCHWSCTAVCSCFILRPRLSVEQPFSFSPWYSPIPSMPSKKG